MSVFTLRRAAMGVRLRRVARGMVWRLITLWAWVWVWPTRSGGITGFIFGFIEETFVGELAQHRRVGMAHVTGLTVVRLERPRVGIRVVIFTVRSKGSVRWAIFVHVRGKFQGGEVLVESFDGHSTSEMEVRL